MIRTILVIFMQLFCVITAYSQEQTTYVQVRTLTTEMMAFPNVGISINDNDFIYTNSNGRQFAEIPNSMLPPTRITLDSKEYEVESWNYTKGTLEIIIREKRYRDIEITLLDEEHEPLPKLDIILDGPEKIVRTSDAEGTVNMPYPIAENFKDQWEYRVPGYEVLEQKFTEDAGTLILKRDIRFTGPEKPPLTAETGKNEEIRQVSPDITAIDTVNSLQGFYEAMKSGFLGNANQEERKKIDSIFYSLLAAQDDTVQLSYADTLQASAGDETTIEDDVSILRQGTRLEERILGDLMNTIQQRLEVLNNKLESDTIELSEESRTRLNKEVDDIESAVTANEERYNAYYQDVSRTIASLREKLLRLEGVEEELIKSEQQRQLEQSEFRKKIMRILAITIGLVILSLILIFLIRVIIRQRNLLKKVNAEISYINANLENLVAQKTESLDRINRELDQFLYQSAHKLRGPLTTIMGLSNVAKLTLTGDSMVLFDKTTQIAGEMDRMLEKLRMISHINYPKDEEPIDFSSLREELIIRFKEETDKNKVNLLFDIEENIGFKAPYLHMDIILTNLIQNAIQFSKEDSDPEKEVKVNISQENGGLGLIVVDHGEGIEEDLQNKVWDMFFVGSDHKGGIGLGLYVVKKAVDMLNGTVALKSKKDELTEITVWIPNGQENPDKEK